MHSDHWQIHDYGPIYAETDTSRFPVEPANTASNGIFVAVFLLLVLRMRRDRFSSPFLMAVLGLLGLGWVGGTLYHASRASFLWLVLDYVPILLLGWVACLRLAFSLDASMKKFLAVVVMPGLGLGWILSQHWLEGTAKISLSYGWFAALLVIPAILHSRSRQWKGLGSLLAAVVSFGAALGFRIYDGYLVGESPRLGTHFLWHLFGGIASGLLLDYLYRSERERQTAASMIGERFATSS